MRAVIIDDEEKSRKLLRNLLARYCDDVEVVDLADSVASGLNSIRRTRPELIFLDIVMPNENGFELIDRLQDVDTEIIFTTAFDQYAIRAIRTCALDYLLKPIDVEELRAAVARARNELRHQAHIDERLQTFLDNIRNPQQKIGLPTQHGVRFYPIEQISVCKAEGNYTTVYFDSREKVELVAKTLKDFEELLGEFDFVRIHRSYLVNLSHLKEYRRLHSQSNTEGDGGCVVLTNQMKLPVSRDRRRGLLERISRPF